MPGGELQAVRFHGQLSGLSVPGYIYLPAVHRRTSAPAGSGRAKWQEDSEANAIMSLMLKLGAERDICVLPVYAVSEDTATTILDLSATMGVDYLIIGASQRTAMAKLLRGSVTTNVVQQLPDSIRLLIFG